MQVAPLKTFILYSPEDLVFKKELEKFLRLQYQKIDLWSDQEINPGENVHESILQNLEEADIILLLISIDFLSSENIRETVFKRAKERYLEDQVLLVPILIRECPWRSDEIIKDLQPLPKDFKPINARESQQHDQVFTEIAIELSVMADRLLARRTGSVLSPAAETLVSRFWPPVSGASELVNPNPIPEAFVLPLDLPYTPDMVFVESGVFEMGGIGNPEEKPVHAVHVPSFRIGKFPVTFAEYDRFCIETQREKPADNGWGRDQQPVINVSWRQALEYCEWLSQKTGELFRLPSEAEWEFAARGGNQSKRFRFAGNEDLYLVAWFWENSGDHALTDFWDLEILTKNHCRPHPVGKKTSNELGLYDMSGNVWEWCADHWHENYFQAPSDGSAWTTGGDSNMRVIRGGSWMNIDRLCQLSYRDRSYHGLRNNTTGFRVVQNL